ncbi:hypothetical protein PTKIN_Ptkin13bG0272300 [Pterospermum kingtungense]
MQDLNLSVIAGAADGSLEMSGDNLLRCSGYYDNNKNNNQMESSGRNNNQMESSGSLDSSMVNTDTMTSSAIGDDDSSSDIAGTDAFFVYCFCILKTDKHNDEPQNSNNGTIPLFPINVDEGYGGKSTGSSQKQ